MGSTPTYDLPYPELTDAPNGPAALRALAEAVEAAIAGISSTPVWSQKVQAVRGVLVPSGSGGVNVNVTWPVAFSDIPAVTIGVNHPDLTNPRWTARSTTGATLRFDRASAGSYYCDVMGMVP